MTNSIENNIFDSHFKSATYVNNEDNWKWSFSKKDTSDGVSNLIGLVALTIIVFTIFTIFKII